jgi:glycosyltransferase involved in cell wall biosynthesis
MTGTDRYYLDLVRSLPDLGIQVQGLVVGEPEKLDDPLPYLHSFAPYGVSRLSRWTSVRRSVRRLLPACDLVVTHGALVAFPTLDLVRKRPLVAHFHGPSALEIRAEARRPAIISYIRHFQESMLYRQADRFIVLSRAFAEVLSEQYGVDRSRVRVIPGGIAFRRFLDLPTRREARELLGWPIDRPVIASVRRLVPSKGIDRLIDAVVDVRHRVPDVFCAIAGDGHLASQLKRQIDERALQGHVRLLGFVPDDQLPLLYRAADLLVVPTVALEGFGLVVLESLACGTPVLVTPVGGLGETVQNLDPGLILPGSSIIDIADGIIGVFRGTLKLPTSEACIEHARQFDWSAIAALIGNVYREVI